MSHAREPDSWKYIEAYIEKQINFGQYKTEQEIQTAIKDFYDSEYLRLGLKGEDPRRANIIRAYWNRKEAFRSTGKGTQRLNEIEIEQEKIKKDVRQWTGRVKRVSDIATIEKLRKELPESIAPEVLPEIESQEVSIRTGLVAESKSLISEARERLTSAITGDDLARAVRENMNIADKFKERTGTEISFPESYRKLLRTKSRELLK